MLMLFFTVVKYHLLGLDVFFAVQTRNMSAV